MTGYARPVDLPSLARNFSVFAAAECEAEPLYAALSRGIAETPDILALVLAAPYRQRRPVLLYACVHDLLLSAVAHPLSLFYRSVAGPGARSDVEAATATFADFCRAHHDTLATMLASRTTQTNEIGRGAVLRAILASQGVNPVALIDVGCSAGLNLLVDRYRFVYRSREPGIAHEITAGPESAIVVRASTSGRAPSTLDAALPPIAARIGLDLSPLDVRDERDARWLQACVWPSDLDRRRRLTDATALARDVRLDLRTVDATSALPALLDALDPDLTPVVFHSWVVSYFDGDSKTRFADAMRTMVIARDGLWISAEGAGVVPGLAFDPAQENDGREATLWHCTRRGVAGDARSTLVARSHPHGRWIEWIDQVADR